MNLYLLDKDRNHAIIKGVRSNQWAKAIASVSIVWGVFEHCLALHKPQEEEQTTII